MSADIFQQRLDEIEEHERQIAEMEKRRQRLQSLVDSAQREINSLKAGMYWLISDIVDDKQMLQDYEKVFLRVRMLTAFIGDSHAVQKEWTHQQRKITQELRSARQHIALMERSGLYAEA